MLFPGLQQVQRTTVPTYSYAWLYIFVITCSNQENNGILASWGPPRGMIGVLIVLFQTGKTQQQGVHRGIMA